MMRWLGCLTLFLVVWLTACGKPAPTPVPAVASAATAVPTALPPTPTIKPTATGTRAPTEVPTRVRPTATATRIPPTPTVFRLKAEQTVTETTKRCQVGLPAGFAADGQGTNTWVSNDRLVFIGLTAADGATIKTLDDATTSAVAEAQKVLAGYSETGRFKGPGYRRVNFTGQFGGQPGWGVAYIRQFGLDFCEVSLIASTGTTILLEPTLETLSSSLIALSPRPGPVGYLALGDSYAVGVGASNPTTLGYAGRFNAALRGPKNQEVSYQNIAASGASSTDFLGDWASRGPDGTSQLAAAVKFLKSGTYNVVTVDIGGNDILRLLKPGQACEGNKIEGEKCLQTMQEILKTTTSVNLPIIFKALVEAAPPGTQLFVMNYPNPFSLGGNSATEERTTLALNELNALIAQAVNDQTPKATERELIFQLIDLVPAFANQAASLTNIKAATPDIHPNDAGHAIIFSAIIKVYLRDGRSLATGQQ